MLYKRGELTKIEVVKDEPGKDKDDKDDNK